MDDLVGGHHGRPVAGRCYQYCGAGTAVTGSLRGRFLLIILVGAVLPLAIAGAWLAQSAVRIAEGQLRTQLDTSLATIAGRMEEHWSYRRADQLLLADNEVSVRTMSTPAASATRADSDYLRRAYDSLRSTVVEFRLVATDGTVRWSFGDTATGTTPLRLAAGAAPESIPYILDTVPINAESGRRVGTLETLIRLSAVLAPDSLPILVKDAQLSITDRRSGRPLDFPGSGEAPRDANRFTAGGRTWIAAHRSIGAPPFELTAAAPADEYVGQYERAAEVGVLVFLAVVALVIALSIYSTTRVTRSLARLADAADAVAGGDLERNVDAHGGDEVARLGRSFNTMIQSLRRTLQELAHREALAAVGEFAASLSHEVRNGLSAVRVDLQRVEEAMPPDDESAGLVTRALRNTRRLDSTVTGALAVARSGRVALDAVELGGVLTAAAGAAEGAFAAAGATLSVAIRTEPCLVAADGAALEQLFLNLLLNAAQAVAPGGGATMELTTDDGRCTVTIEDDGAGMLLDDPGTAGRPFHTSKRGGTGLGLSIARKIAEVHGGDLGIDSAPGEGTVVRVRLPRHHVAAS